MLDKEHQMAERSEAVPVVVFVLFPSLEKREAGATIGELAEHLRKLGQQVWIADEHDRERRLKALYMRELYAVGRGASIVMTNAEGVWLDGWYDENSLPSVDELVQQADRHVKRRVAGLVVTDSRQ
jgi:hypothetical protein